jgi:cytochrome c oxidase subunit 2
MMSGRWRGVATLALGLAVCSLGVAGEATPANGYGGVEKYWLPEGASTYADRIDGLFNAILYLTGFTFIATEGCLLFFLVKYRKQEGRKSIYSHGSHRLEMIWTLIPALILATIAIVQKGAWDEIKGTVPSGPDTVQLKLYGEQFQWNFRYAGTDGKWGTKDDIFEKSMLVVPVHKNIVIEQTSKDVIHSFFLPYMRLKQDLVPGMQIKVWFNATKSTAEMQSKRSKDWNYEIVCAELCGNGHSEMRGVMRVLEQKEYDEWLAKRSADFADEKFEISPIWEHWKVNENGDRIVEEKKTEEKKEHH